jgi:hypothetical protein
MSSLERFISPFIESQFPDFYKDQGPLFILLMEEYYKWLETNEPEYANYVGALVNGNPLYHGRRLTDYKDVDRTIDEFFIHFKEKFVKNTTIDSTVSKEQLIKSAQDIFSSKGSERSIDLLFKNLYGRNIEVYYPGNDVLRTSDGTYVSPIYLELSISTRTNLMVGKSITGSSSGATANIEYIVRRNVNGKIIDVAFLSNVIGTFRSGEIVSEDGVDLNAPKIVGSLTNINLTLSGLNFTLGEEVNITSTNGIEGKALITAVDFTTGKVSITLTDGGWGYTNSTVETVVSSKGVEYFNLSNANSNITTFERFETVTQNNFSFVCNNVVGTISINSNFTNIDESLSKVVLRTQDSGSNAATITLSQISGNVFSNSILFDKNQSIVVTNTNVSDFSAGDIIRQENAGTNNTTGSIQSISNVAIINVDTATIGSNGIHVGLFAEQDTTEATGIVKLIPRENYHTYTNVEVMALSGVTGTFNGSDDITLYTTNAKSTSVEVITPTAATDGFLFNLQDTNLSDNTRFSTSNTIILSGDSSVNNVIKIASDVGGIVNNSTDVSATGNNILGNTTHLGFSSPNNTFYASGNSTLVTGLNSNSVANVSAVLTGSGADYSVGRLVDTESVRINTDLLSSNNDGPGSDSAEHMDILITGANATFGNLSSVYIANSGTGYSNTDTVQFTGGNTGVGSFESGNATITTDASGNITLVTLSSNVGSGIVTTAQTGITTSGGTGANLIPFSSLGFVKSPSGDSQTRLQDLFSYTDYTIGTIGNLFGINPGEDYNYDPFVIAYEPKIAAYGKQDIVLQIENVTGAFLEGENVTQGIDTPGVSIVSNTITGNTTFDAGEFVYSKDAFNTNTATGIISTTEVSGANQTTVIHSNTGTWQASVNTNYLTVGANTNFAPDDAVTQNDASGTLVTSNSTTLIVKDITGSFASNSTPITSDSGGSQLITATPTTNTIYQMFGITSNAQAHILSASACTSSATASARIVTNANNTYLFCKRLSLFNEFRDSGSADLTGDATGSTAQVKAATPWASSNVIGDNAVFDSVAQSGNGSINTLQILNSGLGYVNNETVTISSQDGLNTASGKANVATQGVGTKYYNSTRGFLSNNKYLHDGDFYQNYSYEIRTSIPLDEYFDTVKNVLHVAGKKLFGRLVVTSNTVSTISGNSVVSTS